MTRSKKQRPESAGESDIPVEESSTMSQADDPTAPKSAGIWVAILIFVPVVFCLVWGYFTR